MPSSRILPLFITIPTYHYYELHAVESISTSPVSISFPNLLPNLLVNHCCFYSGSPPKRESAYTLAPGQCTIKLQVGKTINGQGIPPPLLFKYLTRPSETIQSKH